MKYRHRVLGMLFLLSIVTYIDRVCITAAATAMQDDLGIPTHLWGYIPWAFAIAYAAFEIPSGALGDRIGPRKVLTRIVLWWSVFTSLTGAVSNFIVLLVIRFLFGAGEAGAYPNSSSSISRWFPVNERARAQSLVWIGSRLGGAVTPFLVYPLLRLYGWRTSFYVFGVAGAVWAAVWYAWYRDTPREKHAVKPEEIAEIEHGQAPPKAHHGLPWGTVLKKGNFWAILLMYHTYCWGSYFFLSWLQPYLERGRGFTREELQFWSWLPFAFGATGNLLGGLTGDLLIRKIGRRWGRRTVGMVGLAASGAFMLATGLVPGKWAALLLLSLAYGSSDFMLPVAWAVCLDVGRKYAGAVSGAMNMSGQIGSAAIALLFGYLVKWFGGNFDAPMYPMAAMLFVSSVLWLRINAEEELVPETKPEPARV